MRNPSRKTGRTEADGGSSGNAYAGTANDALLGTDTVTPTQRLHTGALDIEV